MRLRECVCVCVCHVHMPAIPPHLLAALYVPGSMSEGSGLTKDLAKWAGKWGAKWFGPGALEWARHVRLAWVGQTASALLRWLSAHTGVPAIVVAAILIVVSYRLAKRSMRFAAEVSVVLALLAALTKLGFLRF